MSDAYTGLPFHTDKAVRELQAKGLARFFVVVEIGGRLEVRKEEPADTEPWCGWAHVLALNEASALELYHNAHDQWAAQYNGDPDWIDCILKDSAERRV